MSTLPHLHSRNTHDQLSLIACSRHLCVSAQTLSKHFLLLVSKVFNRSVAGIQHVSSFHPSFSPLKCCRLQQRAPEDKECWEESSVLEVKMQTLHPDNENCSVDRDYTFKHWPYAIQVSLRCRCIKDCFKHNSTLSVENSLGC